LKRIKLLMLTIKVLIGGTPKSKPCVDGTGHRSHFHYGQ